MDISASDIKSFSIDSSIDGGDTANIVLDNKAGKYNELVTPVNRFSKIIQLQGGYNNSNENLFTGRTVFTDTKEGKLPDTISLTLLERNAYLERSQFHSDMLWGYTAAEIVQYCAKKYMGYRDEEVVFSDPYGELDIEIPVFTITQESIVRALRELVGAFNFGLFNDADGKLCVYSLFGKNVPDMEYDKSSILESGYSISMIEDLVNVAEVIGRELWLDERVGTQEAVLNSDVLPLGYYNFAYIREVHDRKRDEWKRKWIAKTYIPERDSPNKLWLIPTSPYWAVNSDGNKVVDSYVILSIPNVDILGIPIGIFLHQLRPDLAEADGWKWEYWHPVTAYDVDILGFNETTTYARIKGFSTTDLFLHYTLVGNTYNDRYIVKKGVIFEELKVKDVFEENRTKYVTHYYSKRFAADSQTGERICDLTGSVNIKTLNLDWVDSDSLHGGYYGLADTIAENVLLAEYLKAQRFSITVPFNPLVERCDLLKVNLDNPVEFYVTRIQHNRPERGLATSTFSGFVRNPMGISWKGLFGGGDTWGSLKAEQWGDL